MHHCPVSLEADADAPLDSGAYAWASRDSWPLGTFSGVWTVDSDPSVPPGTLSGV